MKGVESQRRDSGLVSSRMRKTGKVSPAYEKFIEKIEGEMNCTREQAESIAEFYKHTFAEMEEVVKEERKQ